MSKLVLLLCIVCAMPSAAQAGLFDLLQPSKDKPLPAMSDADWQAIQQKLGPEVTDPAVSGRVATLVQRLQPYMKHPKIAAAIRPHVLDNSMVNACAWPDGTLVFFTGLLRVAGSDDDMLTEVIGHEMGHVDCQHGRSGDLDILGGILGDKGGLTGLLVPLLTGNKSQDDEFEADLCGLRYMMLAGCSPNGALRQQREFLTRFGTGIGLGQYFSSHPPNSERLRNLQNNIGKVLLECGDKIPTGWCPTAAVASSDTISPKTLCADLAATMNKSRQMQATVLAEVVDLASAKTAGRQAGNDLLVWVEAPQPARKAAPTFRVAIYDISSDLLLLQIGKEDEARNTEARSGATTAPQDDRGLLRQFASVKAEKRGEALALMLLRNRIWQCGGGCDAQAPDTDVIMVESTTGESASDTEPIQLGDGTASTGLETASSATGRTLAPTAPRGSGNKIKR